MGKGKVIPLVSLVGRALYFRFSSKLSAANKKEKDREEERSVKRIRRIFYLVKETLVRINKKWSAFEGCCCCYRHSSPSFTRESLCILCMHAIN